MIKAVIFDLNGVFIKSKYLSKRFEERYGIESDLFFATMKGILDSVRKPDAGDSWQYWEPHIKEWGLDISRKEFFDFWFTGEREVPDMISLARALKDKVIKLFILSNNFIERAG